MRFDCQKDACRVVYCCTVCIFGVVLIVFSSIIFFAFAQQKETYDQMLNNWNQDPIVDIYKPSTLQDDCAPNDISIFSYYWPGTASGCICNNGSITTSQCCSNSSISSKSKNKNCCYGQSISSISEKTLNLWNLSTVANQDIITRLCAKKIEGYNFRQKSPRSTSCSQSEKQCGSQDAILKDTAYCVPKDSKCPIQDIMFSKNIVAGNEWEQVLLQQQPLNQYYLYVKRLDQSSLPLAQFRVSNTDTVCWSDNQSYIPSKSYVLDNRSTNCLNSDVRFRETSLSMDEADYYRVNNIKAQLDKIRGMTYTTYPFELLQKNYIPLANDCRSNIEDYYDNGKKLDSIEIVAGVAFGLCLIYAIQLIFLETWISFAYNKYLWGIIVFRTKLHCCWKVLFVFKVCLLFACIIVCLVLTVRYTQQSKFFKDVIDNNCFDAQTDQYFKDLKNDMNPGLVITNIIVLILILLCEPNGWYIILQCINPNRFVNDKQNNYQENIPPNLNPQVSYTGQQQIIIYQNGQVPFVPQQQYQSYPTLPPQNQQNPQQPYPQQPSYYPQYNQQQPQQYPPNINQWQQPQAPGMYQQAPFPEQPGLYQQPIYNPILNPTAPEPTYYPQNPILDLIPMNPMNNPNNPNTNIPFYTPLNFPAAPLPAQEQGMYQQNQQAVQLPYQQIELTKQDKPYL